MDVSNDVINYPEQLQALLTQVLGTKNVYFQPPEGLKMKFPCIVYQLEYVSTRHADNQIYTDWDRYTVTYIDEDPDRDVPNKIHALPYCSFSRFYISANRNHYAYKLYHKEVSTNG